MKKQDTIHLNIASDIGNGFTKVAINQERMPLQPSLIAHIPDTAHPVMQAESTILSDLQNRLDITIKSDAVGLNGRYLVGQSATTNAGASGYNISATPDKAHSDITIIMNIGMLVLYLLKQHDPKQPLPHDFQVEVDNLATALPIIEASSQQHCSDLTQRYLNKEHLVIVNNFDNPITFKITFKRVSVISEGVVSNIGLLYDPIKHTYRTHDFFKKMQTYAQDPDKDTLKQIANFTSKDIASVGNIIGVDVGDGTVDISVLDDKLQSLHNDQFIDKGIGSVIDTAIDILRTQKNIKFTSRQAFLQQSLRNDRRGAYYQSIIKEQIPSLQNAITEKLKTIFTNLNNDIGLIYFHGAGANVLAETYVPQLKAFLNQFDQWGLVKVLWLDPNESQWLNLDGLMLQVASMAK